MPVPAAVFQRCSITLRQNLKGEKKPPKQMHSELGRIRGGKRRLDINRGMDEEGRKAFYRTFFLSPLSTLV